MHLHELFTGSPDLGRHAHKGHTSPHASLLARSLLLHADYRLHEA